MSEVTRERKATPIVSRPAAATSSDSWRDPRSHGEQPATDLLRIVVGLALSTRSQHGTPTAGEASSSDDARAGFAGPSSRPAPLDPTEVAVGLLFEIVERVRALGTGLRHTIALPALLASRMLGARAIPPTLQHRLAAAAAHGRLEMHRSKAVTQPAVDALAATIAHHPLVIETVNEVIDQVLWPVLDQAVFVVLDRLAADPDAVQPLLRAQSVTLAQELADRTRTGAARGDELVERLVARALRRRGGSADTAPRPAPEPSAQP